MRYLVTCGLVIVVSLVFFAAAAVGATKPAKWMWTVEKVQKRLVAANPDLDLDGNYRIYIANCRGASKAVQKRFTAFRCGVGADDSNNPIALPVYVKIKPVGSGKMCVSRESFAAIPPECLAP
jgi:hypothetical protein